MLEIFCISQPSSLTRRGMSMKQISLSTTRFELAAKRTRKRVFLDEMILVVPWSELVGLIEQHAPVGRTGRPPFEVSTMLRCTAANVNDVTQGQGLLHGEETVVFADVGYQRGPPSDLNLRLWSGMWPCVRANAGYWTYKRPEASCWNRLSSLRPACVPRWSIHSGLLSASSALPRSATKDWPRTRRNWSRCLP